ncbi:MAG TPA: gliding motility-associated C-terminal domain-containing protein, partial [Saprospiraceae bacterium]|nr:gliding motility-associated C-terminal domain-containing protein [Saprospiraceae bacterium]
SDPNNTYHWIIPPEIFLISGANTNAIDIQWADEGQVDICLEVTNSCGTIVNCKTVNLYPQYLIHLDTIICKGTSFLVNGNTYGNGNWTGTEFMSTINGCDSIIEVDVVEATAPPLVIDAEVSVEYNGFGVPCFGDNTGKATVNLISGGSPPFAFQWSSGGNQQMVTNLAAGSYDIIVTDSKGCESSDQIEITEPPQMQYELAVEDISCFGETDGSVQILNMQGGVTPWSTSLDNHSYQMNFLYQNLFRGSHDIIIKDQNDCTFNEQFTIDEPAFWSLELGRDTSVAYGTLLTYSPQIIGSPQGLLQITWSDNECDNCLDRTIEATSNMILSIFATDENGCVAEDAVRIELNMDIFIPNVFSPNGDNVNDHFIVYSIALDEIESIAVYDRWGNQVFAKAHIQPNDVSYGWDGVINGKASLPGVYAYAVAVKFKDGTRATKHGDITLLR